MLVRWADSSQKEGHMETLMSWRDVMDSSKLTASTKLEVGVKNARMAGYQFLSWNGTILFIDEHGIPHKTRLRVHKAAQHASQPTG